MEEDKLNNSQQIWVYDHQVHGNIIRELFKQCPFCGNYPLVFTVPEERYGDASPFSWNIECANMGCIFQRPETGDQSFKHLMEEWNKRA